MKKKVIVGLLLILLLQAAYFYIDIKVKEQRLLRQTSVCLLHFSLCTEYSSRPEPEPEPIEYRSQALIADFIRQYNNTDIIGYLDLPDTIIQYPVAHYEDNEFYLMRNLNKADSVYGSIYMDYECDIYKDTLNTVIYGHSMKDKTMFGGLLSFKDPDYARDRNIIHFDTLTEEADWEIFSCYVTTGDDNYYIRVLFPDGEEFGEFIQTLKNRSEFDTGVEVSEEDRILTLSTCSYETSDSRFVIHAKKIHSVTVE